MTQRQVIPENLSLTSANSFPAYSICVSYQIAEQTSPGTKQHTFLSFFQQRLHTLSLSTTGMMSRGEQDNNYFLGLAFNPQVPVSYIHTCCYIISLLVDILNLSFDLYLSFNKSRNKQVKYKIRKMLAVFNINFSVNFFNPFFIKINLNTSITLKHKYYKIDQSKNNNQQSNEYIPMHQNPIKNKLKRRQTPHQSQFTNQPSHLQKQNANNQNNLHIKPSSKQLSINVSSTKKIPLNLVNIHMESNSVLNKSYSIDVCGTEKCVMAVRKINQGLRVKVGGVQGRIKEMSQKKELLLEKYNKLVESQCKGLKMNCKKINLNNSTTNTNTLTNQNNPQPTTTKNQDINQWDSLLLFQNSQHHPSKPQDSRVKLSQIKQKVNELDLSSISKFAKEKPLTARTHRTSARQQ